MLTGAGEWAWWHAAMDACAPKYSCGAKGVQLSSVLFSSEPHAIAEGYRRGMRERGGREGTAAVRAGFLQESNRQMGAWLSEQPRRK